MVSGSDHTPDRLALAEAAVQAATRLRPDAAETHLARAQYISTRGCAINTGAVAEWQIGRRTRYPKIRVSSLTMNLVTMRIPSKVSFSPMTFGISRPDLDSGRGEPESSPVS